MSDTCTALGGQCEWPQTCEQRGSCAYGGKPKEAAPADLDDTFRQAVLRCRYPVCTSLNPNGHAWDTSRLNEVIADDYADRRERVSADPLPDQLRDALKHFCELANHFKFVVLKPQLYTSGPGYDERAEQYRAALETLCALAAQSQPLVAPSAESHLARIGGAAPKDWRDGWNACREFLRYQVKKGEPS